ncbi:hypothetical protein HK405_005332, partial [Cladochytrium tenue]
AARSRTRAEVAALAAAADEAEAAVRQFAPAFAAELRPWLNRDDSAVEPGVGGAAAEADAGMRALHERLRTFALAHGAAGRLLAAIEDDRDDLQTALAMMR